MNKGKLKELFNKLLEEPTKIYLVGSRDMDDPYADHYEYGHYLYMSKAEKIAEEEREEIDDERTVVYIREIEVNNEE